MNTTYLLIMSAVILITLGGWYLFIEFQDGMSVGVSGIYFIIIMVLSVVSGFLFMGSFCEYDVLKTEKRLAIVAETFDKIVLKATDWPEQTTTDFNALKKPVYVVRTEKVNKWGMDLKVEYTYEFVTMEENVPAKN